MMSYKKKYVPDHPYAMSCGCVYEHRLIMEEAMGRYLLPKEQVHHRDQVKGNNDIKNLVFCPSQKEHSAEHAYDEDTMIERLVLYADMFGHLPSRSECDTHPQLPHSSTYIRRFGSWSSAKRLALRRIDMFNEIYG